ncbi:MAG: hypothetical protein M1524_00295 [Patescibacteria group bacterium]|nr:hypothetical protein [Patescibacteria group bacterium]
MNGFFDRVKRFYRGIPNKKPYIEVLTALLTVPVLLTVIILNINSLQSRSEKPSIATQVPEKKNSSDTQPVIKVVETVVSSPSASPEVCKKQIPEISISYPKEGDKISENPVQFAIGYEKENYCEIVWSYRINKGKWSDYDDKSISVFNLPSGDIEFELRVKGIATDEEKILTRKFIYEGGLTITPTISQDPQATPSAR